MDLSPTLANVLRLAAAGDAHGTLVGMEDLQASAEFYTLVPECRNELSAIQLLAYLAAYKPYVWSVSSAATAISLTRTSTKQGGSQSAMVSHLSRRQGTQQCHVCQTSLGHSAACTERRYPGRLYIS
jgi:hypothetical protein